MKKKIIKFIKENYKSFVLYISLYIILMWPVNYYIIIGGGVSSLDKRVEVTDQYKSKGSFNMSYVSEVKGVLSVYLLSYVIPSWERLGLENYTYTDDEDMDDVEFRGKVNLKNANSSAIYAAFKAAGESIKVKTSNFYVIYADNGNDFKVGDDIISYDGISMKDVDEYRNYLQTKKVGDTVKVKVKRKDKEKEINVTLFEEENSIKSGVVVDEINEYKTEKDVSIKFNKSESGPSAGLMTSLEIYNKLTKKDLTNGKKIAGTGTIEKDGTVGEIGGVKYKIAGAAKKKCDIFIVPAENYKEALKVKKEKKLKIKLIKVKTLDEAIRKLKNI